MRNNKVVTKDDEKYILENYRTVNNNIIGKKVGINPKSVLRILNRLGVKRTPKEIKNLINGRDKTVKGIEKRITIEGGGRKNYKAQAHRRKWVDKNGKIPEGMMLVYSTGDFNSADDLVLIKRKSLSVFIKKREKEAIDAKKREVRERKAKFLMAKEIKNKAKQKEKEKNENFIKELKKKPASTIDDMMKGKVPVRIDNRTIIYVKRERCNLLEDGTYAFKEGETTNVKPIGTFFGNIPEFLKKKKNKKEEE